MIISNERGKELDVIVNELDKIIYSVFKDNNVKMHEGMTIMIYLFNVHKERLIDFLGEGAREGVDVALSQASDIIRSHKEQHDEASELLKDSPSREDISEALLRFMNTEPEEQEN